MMCSFRWIFYAIVYINATLVYAHRNYLGHRSFSLNNNERVASRTWRRDLVKESSETKSVWKRKLQRDHYTNSVILHDANLHSNSKRSPTEREQLKSSRMNNNTSLTLNDNSKRQYIYGASPSLFPPSSISPYQHYVNYRRTGIRRGTCAHHICFHGGICKRTMRGFYCDCQEEYIGVHCEFKRTCVQNPCKNGGTCTELGQGDFSCTCTVGSKGKTCQLKDSCVPNPCDNEARCTEMEDGYHCTCKLGFKGDRCQMKALCYPSPCKNGGTCIDRNDRVFQCSCPVGYKGDLCEIFSECKVDPCVNGGTCIELTVGYRCSCLKGFVGKNCEEALCSPNPCANEGKCKVSGYHHSCRCPKQYVGNYCEVFNPCLNSPCLNGGKCVVTQSPTGDVTGGFTCKCLQGYYGNMCQMR